MRVCIVVEGCYPYVMGGVSSWIQSMITSMPDVEFIIQTIVSTRKDSGRFLFKIPDNVSEIYEIFLQDCDWGSRKVKKMPRLKQKPRKALSDYISGKEADIPEFINMLNHPDLSMNALLMGEDFMEIARDYYNEAYPNLPFADFLWTLRSMYLPLFFALKTPLPKADFYHCVATGYAGMIGVAGKVKYNAGLLVSEHGIYTREREEEIIKAKWVKGIYKNLWINYFSTMSHYTYQYADTVTSLFENVRQLQIELGCPAEKTMVTPNGIDPALYVNMPQKDADDTGINLGAILRIAPIKDVKTMISAYAIAKQSEPRLKLWLMGPYSDQDSYAQECFSLISALGVKDVVFTGRIKVQDYIAKMDMLILTSISEGQPLTILEGFAAKKPCIATNVGNCRGLIYGENDTLGNAGIVLPVMAVTKIADAIVQLAEAPALREKMGEIGYQRLMERYTLEKMRSTYLQIYQRMGRKAAQ